MEVQLESGTRRSQQETLDMVRTGYQTAIDMIDERCAKHPEDWQTLTLAGSLLSDWGDFEYYQQLAGDASTDRMAVVPRKEQSGRNPLCPGRRGVCQASREVDARGNTRSTSTWPGSTVCWASIPTGG